MAPASRSFVHAWPYFLSCIVFISITAPTQGETPRVVQVEEHWQLQLGQPEAGLSAPQTTMVMSPNGGLEGLHFLFTLNHSTEPDYAPGGMQVQAWQNDEMLDDRVANSESALAHAEEVIRWVQRLTLEDSTLNFQVVDGESETWDTFGGDELSLGVATSLTSLNGYKPGISLAESQVSYAENRVQTLTLTKLVWITEDGEVHELNAPIAIDTSLDP
jgi:hypothetical protein